MFAIYSYSKFLFCCGWHWKTQASLRRGIRSICPRTSQFEVLHLWLFVQIFNFTLLGSPNLSIKVYYFLIKVENEEPLETVSSVKPGCKESLNTLQCRNSALLVTYSACLVCPSCDAMGSVKGIHTRGTGVRSAYYGCLLGLYTWNKIKLYTIKFCFGSAPWKKQKRTKNQEGYGSPKTMGLNGDVAGIFLI